MELKDIIEATLFSASKPLTLQQLQAVFPENQIPEKSLLRTTIEAIQNDYQDKPVELSEVASGYRFQVREKMSPWVSKLLAEKPQKYSRALLETLAIIAYRQPVTRGDIEEIRGVSVSSSIVHTLLEREWVRVIGHKEVPGRPSLYATTKQFLDYFNLKNLADLPTLVEIQEIGELPTEAIPDKTSESTTIEKTNDIEEERSAES